MIRTVRLRRPHVAGRRIRFAENIAEMQFETGIRGTRTDFGKQRGQIAAVRERDVGTRAVARTDGEIIVAADRFPRSVVRGQRHGPMIDRVGGGIERRTGVDVGGQSGTPATVSGSHVRRKPAGGRG